MNLYLRESMRALVLGLVIFIVLQGIRVAGGGVLNVNGALLMNFIFTMVYSLVLYLLNSLVFIYLDRRFANDRFTVKRLLLGLALSFTVTLLAVFALRALEEVALEGNSFSQFVARERAANYIVAMIIFFFVSLLIHGFYIYKAYQEQKVREQKIIAGNASAKFESLKNQIDPHFLFNSLNVLSSLIEENPDQAQRFTTSLSKVYRYVLEQKDKELVPVEEELDFAKTYMELLKMRFENSVVFHMPDMAACDPEARVVPLALQLLLENTIKHNVASAEKPLVITICFDENYLVVKNNYQKKSVLGGRKGVGLANIADRYALVTNRKVLVDENPAEFSVRIPMLTKRLDPAPVPDSADQYGRIMKKVDDIRGFYGNLTAYIVVITGLAVLNLVTYPKFLWFLFPMAGWGIGVAIHGLTAFNYMPFLGRDWEERKIREIMKKDADTKWK